jgi:hypothetical protein
MNDDASTFELPEYIHSRLQPQIFIDFPEAEEELQILKSNLPFADDEILEYVVEFLQTSHEADERYSVRDGINIARYALKRLVGKGEGSASDGQTDRTLGYMKEAAAMILDPTATRFFEDILNDADFSE